MSSFADADLRAEFIGRELRGLIDQEREHVLVSRTAAVESLRSLHGQGVIGDAELESLAGFLVVGEVRSRATGYRRWSRLRALGIVLDSHEGDGRVVELASYVRRFADQWRVAA